jgi:hypothetical protein
MVEVEADLSVLFSLFSWNEDGESFSKTFENLGVLKPVVY